MFFDTKKIFLDIETTQLFFSAKGLYFSCIKKFKKKFLYQEKIIPAARK